MPKTFNFIEKLREVGLRPTKQRVNMCEVLFNREKTFHITINDLVKMISEKMNQKISLATVYNTVHAFEKKGYLKEISIDSHKSYFDTNTSTEFIFFPVMFFLIFILSISLSSQSINSCVSSSKK